MSTDDDDDNDDDDDDDNDDCAITLYDPQKILRSYKKSKSADHDCEGICSKRRQK